MAFKTLHLVDPELQEMANAYAALEVTGDSLSAVRQMISQLAIYSDDIPENVKRSFVKIKSRDGVELECALYENTSKSSDRPALMHIHGGGLVMGKPALNDEQNLSICSELGTTILASTYRVAPEHPYPTPLNDCVDCWKWLNDNAEELKLDKNRILLSGDSAGGGLAAALSQVVKDNKLSPIAHLLLIYPMLDPISADASKASPELGEFGWTKTSNHFGWSSYLNGQDSVAPAVPGAAQDLEGLPPCWIGVGSLDLFLDEDIDYARRLMRAGVPTELKIYPSAIHGFPMVAESKVAQDFDYDFKNTIRKACETR